MCMLLPCRAPRGCAALDCAGHETARHPFPLQDPPGTLPRPLTGHASCWQRVLQNQADLQRAHMRRPRPSLPQCAQMRSGAGGAGAGEGGGWAAGVLCATAARGASAPGDAGAWACAAGADAWALVGSAGAAGGACLQGTKEKHAVSKAPC